MNRTTVTSDSLLIENRIVSSSDWLNAHEAANYLRMLRKDGSACVERLRNLVSQGKIPFYKPFGRLLLKRSELERLIEASRKGGFKWR
jgi:hypothetical protein